MPLDAAGAQHHPERLAEVQQHRPLLDVQLEISCGIFELRAAFFDAFEIHADVPERVGQGNAILVLEDTGLVHVEVARASRRAEQTFSKARPFFISPIDEPDRHGRFAGVLGVEASENLDPGQHIEAAIEPAAIGHRVDVTANEQGAVTLAAQRAPEIARGVGMNHHRQRREFFPEPGAGLGPGRSERHALRAVFVAGQGAQFLEFGDRPFRVQRRAHAKSAKSRGARTRLLPLPLRGGEGRGEGELCG